MLESFSAIVNELTTLKNNLVSAELERERHKQVKYAKRDLTTRCLLAGRAFYFINNY